MSPVRLVINGAAGRMGQRLVALAANDPGLELVATLEHAGHARLSQDAGIIAGVPPIGVALTPSLETPAEAMIDFSTPHGADNAIALCLGKKLALVMATTGLEDATLARLHEAAKTIPLLWAPNMSLAVNLAMKLVEMAATSLAGQSSGVDVEIIERHHRFKEDSPSGTAIKFGQIVAKAMGQTSHAHGRQGRPGARPASEIGYHAVRTGDNAGEHTIVFGLLGETLEVRVAASNRDAYALGALSAAKFIAGKPPGLYSMNDVLGL